MTTHQLEPVNSGSIAAVSYLQLSAMEVNTLIIFVVDLLFPKNELFVLSSAAVNEMCCFPSIGISYHLTSPTPSIVSQATPFVRKKKMQKGLVTVHTTFCSIPHL